MLPVEPGPLCPLGKLFTTEPHTQSKPGLSMRVYVVLTPEKKEKKKTQKKTKHLEAGSDEELRHTSPTHTICRFIPRPRAVPGQQGRCICMFYLGQDNPEAAPGPGHSECFSRVDGAQPSGRAVQNHRH